MNFVNIISEKMKVIGISGLDNSVNFKRKKFPNLESRQYRIAQGFDSAAALVSTQGIQCAVAEERFTRDKATNSFPINAIKYCLKADNLHPNDIDYIAHNFCYEKFKSFYQSTELMQQQFDEVYSRDALLRCFDKYLSSYNWQKKLIRVPHHLAHAASSFYVSGFEESLIIVSDGMGEMHSCTVAVGQNDDIKVIEQISSLHSLGILYGIFTLHLGFKFGMDEYKVMGLAPYGDSRRYFDKVMDLINLQDNGTYTIPILFKNQTEEEKETYDGTLKIIADIFGSSRKPESEITQHHKDIAAALQSALQVSLMHVLRYFQKQTGQKNLCLAGGVALNCTANGIIKRSRIFKNIFIQPASGDDGTALGAALYVQRLHEPNLSNKKMALPLWGSSYEEEDIAQAIAKNKECQSEFFPSFNDLTKKVAQYLARGKIIGWFQGRMEFGPRALGNRSILADPRNPQMRSCVNQLIKKREGFRPFAPAVKAEKASKFFAIKKGEEWNYAYMILVTQVKKAYQEKLPAITHVDGSARVQTVSKDDNLRFWSLLDEFEKITDMPILLNTSFNVRGQAIVCNPTEAIDTFLLANLDALVMGNYLLLI